MKISAQKIMDEVGKEIEEVLDYVDEKNSEKLIKSILKAKRIFIAGSGRSGLVGEAFAMRLTQLGLSSYIVGESITPQMTSRDFLLVISGSGKTKMTNEIVKGAKKTKIKIGLITANKKSQIAKKANLIIEIKAKTKTDKSKSVEPLGSLFEQATFIYLDSVVIMLMKKMKKKESFLRKRHSKIR